ncbi:hypothetical protein R1flu_000886 [Riccia fluitans]|uniref:Uncharacterized protein n=1 Tax=Riccia fluitans TaxID=41844 RepID=A0ABD1Y1P9_9MARC
MIRDSQVAPETCEEDPNSDSGEEDPGAEPDERAEDSEGSDNAERDLDVAGDGEDVVMCSDSQILCNVEEVIRTYPEATHGFCFMVMPELLVVYVDCRFDNSRSSYHGTLPIINMEDDRVIEMVTLTRKQTCSSWKIETAALEEALTSLEQVGLKIQEVVHDDNSQVDVILAQHDIIQLARSCNLFNMFLWLQLPKARASIEIQRTRPLRYPELAQYDLAYKLKSWIYTCAKNAAKRGDSDPKLLTQDIHNSADHWAGNHDTCQVLPRNRKCVAENWPKGRDAKYVEGGETHKAVKDFLKKYITESKMKLYIKARENFISEPFHSVINKYATKRAHFDRSHTARLACTALDWNENIRQEVRAVYNRGGNDTTVRRRARTDRKLVPRTFAWKSQLARKVFG